MTAQRRCISCGTFTLSISPSVFSRNGENWVCSTCRSKVWLPSDMFVRACWFVGTGFWALALLSVVSFVLGEPLGPEPLHAFQQSPISGAFGGAFLYGVAWWGVSKLRLYPAQE